MDCEEMLVNQVKMAAATSPGTSYMIYRNFVKALPWYTLVREKITDPAYHSWFLKFGKPTVGNGWHVPQCDNNYSPPSAQTSITIRAKRLAILMEMGTAPPPPATWGLCLLGSTYLTSAQ